MRWRIATLKEHGLGLKEVQAVIATIDPLEGAPEFIAKLREHVQCVILSDTFEEFASPLVRKLGYPPILCNSLEVSPTGEILSHKMRISHSKLSAVRAFQSINYETIAVGDSYNDLEMLNASKKGFLFHASDKMKAENPNLIPIDDFDSLYEAIMQSL